MNSKTRIQLREIQSKLKSPITGQNEFGNENAVMEYAVKLLYEDLKKQRLV